MNYANIQRVFWIYLIAFLLFNFNAGAETAAQVEPVKKAEAAKKPEVKKPETKKEETKKEKQMFAEFDTNMGKFKVLLYADKAPKTVENFVGLAEGTKEFTDPKTGKATKRPFYDGLKFHRVIPDFMIQGGCPVGNGTGGPGYKFADEFQSGLKHTKPGLLSMANAGPNTNGSQFFVTVAATPWLDNRHTIFGEVTEGYDVVQKISVVEKLPGDRPAKDVVINSVKIVR